jgi:hypothetical protein
MASDDSRNKDQEWEERTLCSDDACIGIIGPNGRCNECGKPYTGKPAGADRDPEEELSLSPDALLDEADEDEIDAGQDDDPLEDEEAHWADRILCRDESCIGVIGPDGRCKECGEPLEADEDED